MKNKIALSIFNSILNFDFLVICIYLLTTHLTTFELIEMIISTLGVILLFIHNLINLIKLIKNKGGKNNGN